MATEPRPKSDPDDVIAGVAADFAKLAAILQQSVEQTKARPGQEDALSHLRSAHAAAVRGAELASNAGKGSVRTAKTG